MFDTKFGIVHFGLDIKSMCLVGIVQLFQKTLICALGEATLFIQKIQHTQFLKHT